MQQKKRRQSICATPKSINTSKSQEKKIANRSPSISKQHTEINNLINKNLDKTSSLDQSESDNYDNSSEIDKREVGKKTQSIFQNANQLDDSIQTSSNDSQANSPKDRKINGKITVGQRKSKSYIGNVLENFDMNSKNESGGIKKTMTTKFASNIYKTQQTKSQKKFQEGLNHANNCMDSHSSMNSSESSHHECSLSDANNQKQQDQQIKERSMMMSRKTGDTEKNQDELNQEQDNEMQFIKLMNQFLTMSKRRIHSKDILKFGIEPIRKKEPESEIPYNIQELQKILEKAIDLVDMYKDNHECSANCLQDKISAAAFDFEKVKKLRADFEESKLVCKTREEDLITMQNWLKIAINQNIGVIEVHGKNLVYDAKSLNIFTHDNKFRIGVCWLTEWKLFDNLVIFLIIIGSLCQAIQDKDEDLRDSYKNQIVELIMNITTYFFIVEASLKIISQGLYKHKHSYLRDGWNIVDFSVVLTSIIEMILLYYADDLPSLKMLRALRVIRPLRSVKRVPSMRRLVSIMLKSLPELGNTLVFMMFFFTVFGIIGIQTFHGKIYQRCRLTPEPINNQWEIDDSQNHFICSKNATLNYETQCKQGTYCGSPLEYPHLDPLIDNPWEDPVISHNTINFNNIFVAIVTIFEALTLEGWSIQMAMLIDAGEQTLGVTFYMCLIAFGSYFILNLILAVIMGSFSKFESQEIEQKMWALEQAELLNVKQSAIDDVKEQPVAPKIEKKEETKDVKNDQSQSQSLVDSEAQYSMRDSQFSFKGNNQINNSNSQTYEKDQNNTPPKKKLELEKYKKQKNSGSSQAMKMIEMNSMRQESRNYSTQLRMNLQQSTIEQVSQTKGQIMVSDLNDESNPFQRTTTKLENRKAFSPLETHNKNLHAFQNTTNLRNDESISMDTPLDTPIRRSLEDKLNDQEVKNNKQQKVVLVKNTKSELKIKQNIESEDKARFLANKNIENRSEKGTENALHSQRSSILDISDENNYDLNYKRQVDSKDDLHLESLNFEDIIFTKKGKGIENYNDDPQNEYEGGSPKKGNSPMSRQSGQSQKTLSQRSKDQLLRKKDSIESVFDDNQGDDQHVKSKFEKATSRCKNALGGCYDFFARIFLETEFHQFFNVICKSQFFASVVLLTIFINTTSLSLDRYPIDPDENAILETINNYCTWIFVAEMSIKIFGLGIKTYAMDSFNQFDATVVIVSVVEFVLQKDKIDEVQDSEENYITIFRGFRLLRVFRLARNWKSFHIMMVKIVQTINDIFTFFVLLIIVVFVFALLGNEIFNNDLRIDEYDQVCEPDNMDPTCVAPRLNFDSFMNGFVTVFVCLIGEDWQLIMHQYIRSHRSPLLPYIYFVSIMVIGNLFLMNLFLAILLKNFEDKNRSSEQEEEKEDEDLNKSKFQTSLENMRSWMTKKFFKNSNQLADINSNNYAKTLKEIQTSEDSPNVNKRLQFGYQQSAEKPGQTGTVETNEDGGEARESNNPIQIKLQGQIQNEFLALYNRKKKMAVSKNVSLIDDVKKVTLEGNSLFIFKAENFIRRNLAKVVVHKHFEMFIFAIVIFSAILMIFEDPLTDPNQDYIYIIQIINTVITATFILELILKVIVFGLIFNGKASYLKNGWNILDFFIVSFSIASLVIENQKNEEDGHNQTAQNLQILKMLRVLRSIRIITKTEGLQLSVLSLIYSMPGIMNVTVVTILFFVLLGIFFLNMLKGKFHHCIYPTELDDFIDKTQVKTRLHCMNFGGIWHHQVINFDSIGNSVLALFTMSTTEGWVNFMDNAVDSVGIGLEPQRGENLMYQYIFIVYMIFGSLFITNLFIEVVINTFDKEKNKIDRNFKLTNFQKEWIFVQLKCYQLQPSTQVNTTSRIRQYCIKVVEYKYFDALIMTFIVMNALILSIVWINIDPRIIQYTEQAQEVLNIIFMIECILKLIAYKKFYFNSGWNVFDFIIVAGGLLGLLVKNQLSANISVIRILRVCRILRLLKKAKRLYIIFNSFIHTIPAFMNVGGLIMVMIYIFAIIGNRAFAPIKAGEYLNNHRNFETFFGSFLTLIQCMTGEGWYELMGDLQRQNSVIFECKENPEYIDYKNNNYKTVGCGTDLSPLYFIIYIFFVSLILVNLFIAVTLQGFNDVQTEDRCRITDFQLNTFIDVWTELDPDGTGYIHISEAAGLMRKLIEKKCELFPSNAKDLACDQNLVVQLIEHLQLKLYKKFQYYNFHDIMISLSQMHLTQLAQRDPEIDEILEEFYQTHHEKAEDLDTVVQKIQEIQDQNNVKLCKELGKALVNFKNNVLSKIDRFEGNVYTSSMIPTVIRIQSIFRKKKKERQVREYQALIREQNLQRRGFLHSKNFDEAISPKKDLVAILKDKQKKTTMGELEQMIKKGGNINIQGDNVQDLIKAIQNKDDVLKIPKQIRTLSVVNSKESLMPTPSNRQRDVGAEEFDDIQAQSHRDSQKNQALTQRKEFKELQIIKLKKYQKVDVEDVKIALDLYLHGKNRQSRSQTRKSVYSDNSIENRSPKTNINTQIPKWHHVNNRSSSNDQNSRQDYQSNAVKSGMNSIENDSSVDPETSNSANNRQTRQADYKVYLMRNQNLKIPARNSPQAGTK